MSSPCIYRTHELIKFIEKSEKIRHFIVLHLCTECVPYKFMEMQAYFLYSPTILYVIVFLNVSSKQIYYGNIFLISIFHYIYYVF
jgi:hypothetical protein